MAAVDAVPAYIVVDDTERAGDVVVMVGGELDMTSRDEIEPQLMAVIAAAGAVVVDLSELTFCDSTGVAMFIAAHEKARAAETRIVFRGAQGPVLRVFRITGVDALFGLPD